MAQIFTLETNNRANSASVCFSATFCRLPQLRSREFSVKDENDVEDAPPTSEEDVEHIRTGVLL